MALNEVEIADENIIDLFGSAKTAEKGDEDLQPTDPFQGREFLAHDFLLWLWFRSERDFGAFKLPEGPIDLWLDDRLVFLAADESKVSSVYSGGSPAMTPEARLSLLSGKVISEVRVGMRRGDSEWSFVLRVRGGEIELRTLRVPAVIAEGATETILERMALVDSVVGAV